MAFINANWNKIAPLLLDYNYTVKDELKDSISQTIRDFYFTNDGGEISIPNWKDLVQVSIVNSYNLK